MGKPRMPPAMQAAVIRGLVRELTDLRAQRHLNDERIARAEADLAKARKGEF